MTLKEFPKAPNIYLVVKGEKPKHHNAPFHPVVVCSRRHVAEFVSRGSENGCTVFYQYCPDDGSGNWFLCKYKGFTADGVVSNSPMFKYFDDKTVAEICDSAAIFDLMAGAVWWSFDKMPEWVSKLGVIYPPDNHTRRMIWEFFEYGQVSHSKMEKARGYKNSHIKPSWLEIQEIDGE